MKLVVGLGNPGKEYEMTRHNIGQLALDQLSFSKDLIWKNKFQGLFSCYNDKEKRSYLLKPTIFMNKSGESVQAICSFFKISIGDVLIVHDELDLPFGTMALKMGGGTAGHNGLNSVAQMLGELHFKRLRLGIGRPLQGSVSDYVLGRFNKKQEVDLEIFLLESAKAIEVFIKKGIEPAATRYSRKNTLI